MTVTEIYVLLPNNAEWEDMIIFLDKDAALSCLNKKQDWRIEVFKPKHDSNNNCIPSIDSQFEPTYITLLNN